MRAPIIALLLVQLVVCAACADGAGITPQSFADVPPRNTGPPTVSRFVNADADTTLRVRGVASNGSGSAAADSEPSRVVHTHPIPKASFDADPSATGSL